MLCPRCETPALDERERDGVTVDVCRSCRGVWLDRGEMEKLIARALAEAEAQPSSVPVPPPPGYGPPAAYAPPPHAGRPWRRDDDDDDEDDDDRRAARPYVQGEPPKKKGWLRTLSDLID